MPLNPGDDAPSASGQCRHTQSQPDGATESNANLGVGMSSNKEENMLLNPGGADPAQNVPSRRNYTVSQVPMPPYTKLANPGPLGLLSFALTTFALGLYECGAG